MDVFAPDVMTAVAPLSQVRCLFEARAELPDTLRFDGLQESAGADVWLPRIAGMVVVIVRLRSEARLSGAVGSPAEVSAAETPASS